MQCSLFIQLSISILVFLFLDYCEYWLSEHRCANVSLTSDFISCTYVPNTAISRSDDNYILIFEESQQYFHNVHTNLHSK